MTDTTATIAAKGCNATGITEDLAASLHNNLGKKLMAVVELEVATRAENADGKEKVGLRILTIEPAPNTDSEKYLRELTRSFHYERKVADGQLTINTGDDIEPKVADVLAAGQRHTVHDFLDDGAGSCEVCEEPSDHQLHTTTDDLDDLDDPEDDDADADDGDGNGDGDIPADDEQQVDDPAEDEDPAGGDNVVRPSFSNA